MEGPTGAPRHNSSLLLTVLLVRHAQSTWNDAGRIQGQADPPLSARGRRQCAQLHRGLRGVPIDQVFSSDLERAMRTAAALPSRAPLVATAQLREVDLGDWEGATQADLRGGWPHLFAAWQSSPSWDLVPGGEGQAAFETRAWGALQDCLGSAKGARAIALVTHIGVIRALLSRLLRLPSDNLRWPWTIENTSLTTLAGPGGGGPWREPDVTVRAINDTIHLGPLR